MRDNTPVTLPAPLIDQHGRTKQKLRVSLTDRCQYRCTYCMPTTPTWIPQDLRLTAAERNRLITLMVQRGITHIRLTGGEPLIAPDLYPTLTHLQSLRAQGLTKVSLTTNGALLAQHAATLLAAGLDDVNVSLDTLNPERFLALSGGRGTVDEVLEGIAAAQAVGLAVKLNCVVLRDVNFGDMPDLTRWAMAQHLPLRLIEFMPLDDGEQWQKTRVVSEAELLTQLGAHWRITPQPRDKSPATTYLLDDAFPLGIISTITNPFCSNCNRLRLTADGQLFSCLFAQSGQDLRALLRAGNSDDSLTKAIARHVWNKARGFDHAFEAQYTVREQAMYHLGG